jgi:hypothetical protein
MDAKIAAAIITRIKKEYPKPRTAGLDSGYCVGGALFRGTQPLLVRLWHRYVSDYKITPDGVKFCFPYNDVLAAEIQRLNPVLSYNDAFAFARDITTNNDNGLFDHAWRRAENALVWPSKSTNY